MHSEKPKPETVGRAAEPGVTKAEKEKEGFPPAPPYTEKEKDEKSTVSVSVSNTRTRGNTDSGSDTALPLPDSDTAGLRRFFNTDSGTAQRRRIDAAFILHGAMGDGRRNDPVQMALIALGIPAEGTGTNGRRYNNAAIMRWYLRRLGEENFRELVYRQWRENMIDGPARNAAAVFMAKLWAAGGAR